MTLKAKTVALAAALGLLAGWAAAGPPAADSNLEARIAGRIRDWQPTAAERRFDDIGWARDIRDALRLAKAHDRPVFLFTYDGAAMANFRC